MKSLLGLVGLGVMGRNLALNLAEQNVSISAYSRETREVEAFQNLEVPNTEAFQELDGFMASLAEPKTVMLMITAGPAVDEMISKLLPYLHQGDIIIDGGNSYFKDTIRRCQDLHQHGVHFVGCGVSGGEEGARHGASLMPGGSMEAWEHIRPILESLAAKDSQGEPCCRYIGPDGAGHFVKMVHNGIEYADMQLIGETYLFMKNVLGLRTDQMRNAFAEWNRGELHSYLMGITADILSKTDEATGKPLVEMILDTAGQKGTGQWAAQEALELKVPAPSLAEAVFARCLSALKAERTAAAKVLGGPPITPMGSSSETIAALGKALYAGKISIYAQGFLLIRAASERYGWNLDLAGIAAVWRAGCIIQADLVGRIRTAFAQSTSLPHLFMADPFIKVLSQSQSQWRSVVMRAIEEGVPMAVMGSTLAYYDAYRTERLPANLLQAQRDYFGAHTYERIDCEGRFHTHWLEKGTTAKSNPV